MDYKECKQLDAVYAKYLVMLRNKIMRIEDEKVIELCQRWLSVFNTSPPKHKVSRNFLMSILLEQLECSKKLSEPFTNPSNLEKDLCKIAQGMGLESVEDQNKEQNQSDTFDNFDFASDKTGVKNNDMNAHCPSPISTNFNTSSEGDFHITQIDELSKLIIGMKKANECLRSELEQLKQEKDMLEMTNEQQSKEMEELLNVVKSCKDLQFIGEQSEENEEGKSSEIHISTTPLAPGDPSTNPSQIQKDNPGNTAISEQGIFDALNDIITNLRGIALAENPLDQLRQFQVKTFSQMFEAYPNIAFQTKLILYENTIQNLVFQVIQTTKNAYDRKLRCIMDKLGKDPVPDARSAHYKESRVNWNERATDCRESPSKCETSECGGSVSDYDNRKMKCIHMKYFRKCLIKMQNHFDEAVAKYEKKLQAQKLQNKLRKEVMKLKLISVSHQIFLESSNKTQKEIYQLVNKLETQYNHIVSEADDDEQDCGKLSETPKISPTKQTPNLEC